MVGEDGQTHMGLYDIAYLLAVPNFTVTAPRDGAEVIGLLRCALAHTDGPFSLRYPRDKAPGEAPPAAEVAPVPYGTWEVLRRGRECALLAVGVMCQPALAAAAELAAEGLDVSVVNCRFLKPMDRALLDALVREHRLLVTIEDGTVVNGFGAALAAVVRSEEHTSELQSQSNLVCRLLLEKKKNNNQSRRSSVRVDRRVDPGP